MLILHGENVVLSRQELSKVVDHFPGEVTRLEANQLDLTSLKQALESVSLFGQDRLVILENLFSRRASREKENLLRYLKKNQPENIVLWEGKTIDGRSLNPFSKAEIKKFALTPFVFRFLDSLAPDNQKDSLSLLHRSLNQDPAEMVFYLLARQVRYLIIALDLGEKGLERMASWQKAKFFRQAKKFDLAKLLWLHQELLRIDYEQKTGQAPLSLSGQLDLLIASL